MEILHCDWLPAMLGQDWRLGWLVSIHIKSKKFGQLNFNFESEISAIIGSTGRCLRFVTTSVTWPGKRGSWWSLSQNWSSTISTSSSTPLSRSGIFENFSKKNLSNDLSKKIWVCLSRRTQRADHDARVQSVPRWPLRVKNRPQRDEKKRIPLPGRGRLTSCSNTKIFKFNWFATKKILVQCLGFCSLSSYLCKK